MNTLTRLAVSLSLVGLSCSLPITAMATAGADTHTKVTTDAKQKASFLFVLRADTGVIAASDGGYTLTLQGMDDKVLYFSDRPVRKAGFITMTRFMSDWAKGHDSFQANPPNAAIVHAALKTNENGIAQAIPVELTNPVATTNGWSFSMKDLQGKLSIGSYNGISVFVDGGCSGFFIQCVGGDPIN
ncbi:hypothetical protein [Legionella yabuuchiae]|uniref:hypothetical protein n=1 Tax=Legionella yabuuchiae TaxID=376727 RepID=UPI001054365E|nr:hypothetical protein [Legionella yabuuchiae]